MMSGLGKINGREMPLVTNNSQFYVVGLRPPCLCKSMNEEDDVWWCVTRGFPELYGREKKMLSIAKHFISLQMQLTTVNYFVERHG